MSRGWGRAGVTSIPAGSTGLSTTRGGRTPSTMRETTERSSSAALLMNGKQWAVQNVRFFGYMDSPLDLC